MRGIAAQTILAAAVKCARNGRLCIVVDHGVAKFRILALHVSTYLHKMDVGFPFGLPNQPANPQACPCFNMSDHMGLVSLLPC